jgi:adenylate cyclase
MDIGAVPRMIRFGHCTLDEGRGVLIAPDGSETPLRPKTHELLRLLLKHPGRVVARTEILDAVWPGIFVTDDSITQCVVELRKAMGAGGASLLRTLPRRGYLLQADVIAEALPEPAMPGRTEDRPSIAVLPFRKERGDPQETYFEDGIIEGIVHVLSGLERIMVVSRGSALAVAEQTIDPREVGKRLGVRYVLHGGVRRAGDRLRITTELSEAETGAILRTDRYDGDATDIFALQDRIAEAVVAVIAPQVRERELARALRKPPSSVTAYDLVLRALDQMRHMERDAMLHARSILERAISVEPDHALAYSHLAWWHAFWFAQGWSEAPAADAKAAEDAAGEALERDRRDGMALAVRGLMLSYTKRDIGLAREFLDRAVAMSPSCALAWSCGAGLRCWVGEGAEAVAWAERAVRLAPFDPFTFLYEATLAQAHYTSGSYVDALGWCHKSAASNPKHSPTWRTMIACLIALGRHDDVRSAVDRLLTLQPDFRLGSFAMQTPLEGSIKSAFISKLKQAGLPD